MTAKSVAQVVRSGTSFALREDRSGVLQLAAVNVASFTFSAASVPLIERALAQFKASRGVGSLSGTLAIVLVLSMFAAAASVYGGARAELLGERLRIKGVSTFNGVASVLELQDFDEPEIMNITQRAEHASARYEVEVVQHTFTLASGVSRTLGLALGAIVVAPILSIILALAFVPVLGLSSQIGRLRFATNAELSDNERRTYYLAWLFTARPAAIELRSLGIAEQLNDEFSAIAEDRVAAIRESLRRQTRISLALLLIITAVLLGGFQLAVHLGWFDGLGLAATGAVIAGLAQASAAASSIGWPVSQLVEAGEFLADRTRLEEYAAEQGRGDPGADRDGPVDDLQVLELAGVSYRYPGAERQALTGVDLTVARGQTVALVGPNGGGKSTLAKLIGQLLLPTDGVVRWNGQDTRLLDPVVLRRHVAAVHQTPFMFLHSVRTNVSFGRGSYASVDDEEVLGALLDAQVAPLVREIEDLDLQIGPEFGGFQPSGGQAQAISIARALYSDREILVLDEPTSSIDPSRESTIMAAIRAYSADRTAIIVAHRLSAVRFADLIVVVDDGRIIETGTHESLLNSGGLYSTLYAAHRAEIG